jgi:membrane-bound ClpP family serine protease
MNIRQIKSNSIGLLVGGILLFVIGTYTDNGGFQFAGGILLVVSVILALHQATQRSDDR